MKTKNSPNLNINFAVSILVVLLAATSCSKKKSSAAPAKAKTQSSSNVSTDAIFTISSTSKIGNDIGATLVVGEYTGSPLQKVFDNCHLVAPLALSSEIILSMVVQSQTQKAAVSQGADFDLKSADGQMVLHVTSKDIGGQGDKIPSAYVTSVSEPNKKIVEVNPLPNYTSADKANSDAFNHLAAQQFTNKVKISEKVIQIDSGRVGTIATLSLLTDGKNLLAAQVIDANKTKHCFTQKL